MQTTDQSAWPVMLGRTLGVGSLFTEATGQGLSSPRKFLLREGLTAPKSESMLGSTVSFFLGDLAGLAAWAHPYSVAGKLRYSE